MRGAVAGQRASLTFALLGCFFFFSGVTSESLAHIKQTAAGFTWKPPEANALTPGLIGMFLPPQMSYPPKKRKLHPDSHTVNQAGLKVPVVHFQVLFRFLSHLSLSLSLSLSLFFFFLPPSLSLSSLSLLWISAHCATRKCTSRACQLHHGAFHLERPEPSVYQWNQPGIQGEPGAVLSTGAL